MTAVAPISTTGTTSSTVSTALDNTEIASNFTTFLQLLTTQLKNQNPLDPLDTNQFTQQLVQFAQVEQQMKSNDQLSTPGLAGKERAGEHGAGLCRRDRRGGWLDRSAARTAARPGISTSRSPRRPPSPSRIRPGQTVYYRHGSRSIRATQNFTWDGRGNDGRIWPDGNYTLTATGRGRQRPVGCDLDARCRRVVDSVDLSQNPPVLSINGQNYTLDKIKRVVRARPRLSSLRRARARGAASPIACSIARSSADSSNGLRKISKRPSAAAAASL